MVDPVPDGAQYVSSMPLVDVTHHSRVSEADLTVLAELLPDAVARAVECPEEPYVPPLSPGDVEIRFRPRDPHDPGGLDVVVEVRSRWFESRAVDRDERCERLCAEVATKLGSLSVGVYLSLPVAGWAQTD